MKKFFFIFLIINGILFFNINLSPVFAYVIENLQLPEKGDFILAPGKIELLVNPGDEYTKEISIANRIGRTMNFNIDIEDFKGSENPEETVVLLGKEKGPYSLKDYIQPEMTNFTLNHGQRITLPVKISIPKDAEPRGLYGSVLITTNPPEPQGAVEKEKATGQMKMVSRLGCLVFIRVNGEAKENGVLKNFITDKKFYENASKKNPVSFQIFFENKGNVHLNPYGIIEIKNILGKKVGEIEMEPFFAMPDSLRKREVKWDKEFLFGRYTAFAGLNRGYQNIIDQKSLSFWVIPWKLILVGLIILFLVLWFFKWALGHFEIRKKETTDNRKQ
ncbi:hypothetical protein KKA09_01570 [Patescibacteria group bacterium]|nr:hypothetical protein [Patescibacteria group bacterium]